MKATIAKYGNKWENDGFVEKSVKNEYNQTRSKIESISDAIHVTF
jgi:hypothetical protein